MNAALQLAQLVAGRSGEDDLSDLDWRHLLQLADRTLSTPSLISICTSDRTAGWFANEVDQRVQKVAARRSRLVDTYREVAAALQSKGIEFMLLKGFTHEVGFGIEPTTRVQQDIDLLCQSRDLAQANNATLRAGFQIHGRQKLSANHSQPLVKPHTWKWRGDYFDPEMPVAVELHHCLWSEDRYRICGAWD